MSNRPIEFPVEGLCDRGAPAAEDDADLPAVVEACQDPEIPRWTRVPDHYGERGRPRWAVQEAARQHDAGEGLGC